MASARATYGISVTIAAAAITALTDITPPNLQAIDPVDDSRHGDSDGIERFVPSGRFKYTDLVITCNDVASCPGIAAAITAIGGAAVAIVITYPSSGGTVTVNALIQSADHGTNPLTGKRERVIVAKVTPVRA